jgi:O-antigen ligase
MLVIFVSGAVSAVIATGLYLRLLIERDALSLAGLLGARLVPIGRASHEIGGATALAVAAFAGWSLRDGSSRQARLFIGLGLAAIILTMILTQSRGAFMALVFAAAISVTIQSMCSLAARQLLLPLAVIAGFALPVALILFEPQVRDAICSMQLPLCRSSNRQDIWLGFAERLLQSPWFGWGPHARLEGDYPAHPHNVLLGTAFYFGLPILLPLLLMYGAALLRVAASPLNLLGRFAMPCLAFAAISLATDRPNVFGDLNAHFLYLWLPIGLASTAPVPAPDETGPA